MKHELTEMSSKYGAPMGRHEAYDPSRRGEAIAFQVVRLVWEDGDYDTGGAYWGGGSGENIYHALAGGIELFKRAKSFEDAERQVLADYPLATFTRESQDKEPGAFLSAYITAALWSSTDDDGDPLDNEHSADDLAPETLAAMQADCDAFQAANAQFFTLENHRQTSETTVAEFAAHDFWLTRNGHGCGFWDGDWTEPAATILTDAAQAFGAVDLYLGDDGRIYG